MATEKTDFEVLAAAVPSSFERRVNIIIDEAMEFPGDDQAQKDNLKRKIEAAIAKRSMVVSALGELLAERKLGDWPTGSS